MGWLTAVNARLSRWAMYVACACLAGLLSVVVYGVVLRYVFNAAPPYVEQVALLLIISVAMFGAAAGVRDAGHIGLDSLVAILIFVTVVPLGMERVSGSAPRFPTRITLFTPRAMLFPPPLAVPLFGAAYCTRWICGQYRR